MRTTIIPAQITTVEDKIAGSLNMTQILILMFPVLGTAILYILFPPGMKLVLYKLMAVTLVVIVCVTLIIRVKGKIIAEWIGVVLRYQLRPKFWIYNKNDLTSRTVDIPDIPESIQVIKRPLNKLLNTLASEPSISDLVKIEQLIGSGKVAVRYQLGGKRS